MAVASDGNAGAGGAGDLSPRALEKLPHSQLVEMLMAARQDKASVEEHCGKLARALQHAEASIDDLEAQLQKVQRAHERELGLLFDESLALRAEMDYKATTAQLDNQRMHAELSSYIVMEEQNKTLKESLSLLHDDAKNTSIRHKEEVAALRESVVEHKAKLHKEFRARVQEVSVAMGEEARRAVADQARPAADTASLVARAEERQHHISTLMHRYTHLEALHAKVKLDYGLAQQSMEFQTKEMLQLKRELLESRERCASVEQDLRDARGEREAVWRQQRELSRESDKVQQLEDHLHALRNKYAKALHSAEHWKQRAAAAARLPGSRAGGAAPGPSASPSASASASASAAAAAAAAATALHHYASSFPALPSSSTTRSQEEGAGRLRASKVYSLGGQQEAGERLLEQLLPPDDEDVRKIWNSKYQPLAGAGLEGRSQTAPPLHPLPDHSSSSSLGQYAQLHLPAGGPALFPSKSSGRRTAPPSIFASGKLPAAAQSARYL